MAEREDLLAIRNEILGKKVGLSLLAFLQNKVTDYATKNLDAITVFFRFFSQVICPNGVCF